MSKIDLQLIQDNYTNFILYDDSNRGYQPNRWVSFNEVQNITSITVTLKYESNDPITIIIGPEDDIDNYKLLFDFSSMTTQEDFAITIPYEMFDDVNLPEGKWVVTYTISAPTIITADGYTEYSFKQTEIYRDKLFLHAARSVINYNPYYASYKTDKDKFRMQILYFDTVFKAFKAQVNSGNSVFASKTLQWLKDFQLSNPIDKILETND